MSCNCLICLAFKSHLFFKSLIWTFALVNSKSIFKRREYSRWLIQTVASFSFDDELPLPWHFKLFAFVSVSVWVFASHTARDSVTLSLYSYSLQLKKIKLQNIVYESPNIIHLHWYCVWFIFDDRPNWHKIKIRCNCFIRFFAFLVYIFRFIFFAREFDIQSVQVDIPWRRKSNEIDSHWSVNEPLIFLFNLLEIFRHCTMSQILSASVRKNIGSIKMQFTNCISRRNVVKFLIPELWKVIRIEIAPKILTRRRYMARHGK